MTLEVHTVNLLLETRGGARHKGGATWASPMASITIRNLVLCTTNESWQVVNLKEARDFSNNKKFIYVFKKLEWECLSIDLLPHPDMFADASFARSQEGNKKDDDGAKRIFFGGERFIEGISGHAHITLQRTELNSPLGLEVQLHITEAVCPALSEPGLRALLRFLTGLYVCLNRGDVNPNSQQRSMEAAGRSVVSLVVDHIFLCIKDADFQLELLMQSLFFSRASVSDGGIAKYLTRVMISGLFLRDTFSRPPCTLVQPSMLAATENLLHVPNFGKDFCPPIYPLGDQQLYLNEGVPLICLHSLQVKPSPNPPSLASQTVIDCQPLMIYLHEDSCLRISSFLADGIVVNSGAILPDFSINSLMFNLNGLDITISLDLGRADHPSDEGKALSGSSFAGARLHIENLFFLESPFTKLKLLNLEKDPACFCLWEDQPVDASQKKWTTGASLLSLSLETLNGSTGVQHSLIASSDLWRCVDLKDACIEVAMVTADGCPLTNVPPPGGIVRVGVACQQYISNTSVEQLFFVLDLYAYFGRVAEKLAMVGRNNRPKNVAKDSIDGRLIEKVPSDTAVSLAVKELQLRFLESSSMVIQGIALVQFVGDGLFIKVAHRTLGGAMAVSSNLRWERVEVDCADTEETLPYENGTVLTSNKHDILASGSGHRELRPVFWVQNRRNCHSKDNAHSVPFLDLSMVHVIPYSAEDMECHSLSISACIAGVRLGGGMTYAEALLHRFGILGSDGGPGEGLSKGLERLSDGPLSKLFKHTPLIVDEPKENMDNGNFPSRKNDGFLHLGTPDDVDVSVELKDWLFALEGAEEMAERGWLCNYEDSSREERCWHTTFQRLLMKAKSTPKHMLKYGGAKSAQKFPFEVVMVSVEGLQTLKPQMKNGNFQNGLPRKGLKETADTASGGINVEVDVVVSEDDVDDGVAQWLVENLKFSIKQPIEAVVTKDELQYLVLLCKSEVDSMGRIAAGILRVLKLEGSIGQAAIDKLSNLGSEGFDKIFSPDKLSRGSSAASIGFSPTSNGTSESLHPTLESTVASLEAALLDSQTKCNALSAELCDSESSISNIRQLSQKLESMQNLLTRLRTQL